MIQATHVIFQTDLKPNLHVGWEGESLHCTPKWQPVSTRFRVQVYKTLRHLPGKDPGLLTWTDVVIENAPTKLTEKESRPFQNSTVLQSDIWNGQGLPYWICHCESHRTDSSGYSLCHFPVHQVCFGGEAILCLPYIRQKSGKEANSIDAKFSGVFMETMVTSQRERDELSLPTTIQRQNHRPRGSRWTTFAQNKSKSPVREIFTLGELWSQREMS